MKKDIDWNLAISHLPTVKKMLQKNPNFVNIEVEGALTALSLACVHGYTEVVKLLLSSGADVNIPGMNRWTALMYASAHNHFPVVETLLKSDAAVDAKDAKGRTSFIIACSNGHLETANVLANAGANLFLRDAYHYTALQHAVFNANPETVLFLLNKETDINQLFEIDYILNDNNQMMPGTILEDHRITKWVESHIHELNPKSLEIWKRFRLKTIFV